MEILRTIGRGADAVDRVVSDIGESLLQGVLADINFVVRAFSSQGLRDRNPGPGLRRRRRAPAPRAGSSRAIGSTASGIENDYLTLALQKVAEYCKRNTNNGKGIRIIASHGIEDDLKYRERGPTYDIFYFGNQQFLSGQPSHRDIFEAGLDYAQAYYANTGIRLERHLLQTEIRGFMEYASRSLNHPQRKVIFKARGLEIIAPPVDFTFHWNMKNAMTNPSQESAELAILSLRELNEAFLKQAKTLNPAPSYILAVKESVSNSKLPYNYEWKYRGNYQFCTNSNNLSEARAMVTFGYLANGFKNYCNIDFTEEMAQILNAKLYTLRGYHGIAFPTSELVLYRSPTQAAQASTSQTYGYPPSYPQSQQPAPLSIAAATYTPSEARNQQLARMTTNLPSRRDGGQQANSRGGSYGSRRDMYEDPRNTY